HEAVRTRRRDRLRTGRLGLGEAGVVDACALRLLHPHPGAARAAAEGALAVPRHLDRCGAGGADHVARSVEASVVPAEVARVVVGDGGSTTARLRGEPPL